MEPPGERDESKKVSSFFFLFFKMGEMAVVCIPLAPSPSYSFDKHLLN